MDRVHVEAIGDNFALMIGNGRRDNDDTMIANFRNLPMIELKPQELTPKAKSQEEH